MSLCRSRTRRIVVDAPRTRPARAWSARALTLGVVLAPGLGAAVGAEKAAVIPIHGTIDAILKDSVERRMSEARAEGATTLIFEMDTPGGELGAAFDIFQLIERSESHTIAWVNPMAYSAGALISVACNEIWMSPGSSIGDCAPILLGPGGPQSLGETERAKVESPLLQKFRTAAARNGYSQALSRAMVTLGEEVWWVKNTETGEQRFVSPKDKAKLIPDSAESETQPATTTSSPWKLVKSYSDAETGEDFPIEQPVNREDMLLTMSQSEAVAFGFAKGVVRTPEALAERLEITGELIRYDQTGWEVFAIWLNSPVIRGMLLVLVLIGGYMELQSPGLIVPGAVALVALAIFLAAPYAAGLAWAWPIILIVLGLILLGVEAFVLPGFGIAGIIGGLCLIAGLLVSFVPADPQLPPLALPDPKGVWEGLMSGMRVLAGSLLVSIAGIFLLIRYLPQSRVAEGVISGNPDAATLSLSDAHPGVAQIGDVGVVTGDLRPGGQARFGQEIVDVHSQTGYVGAGQRVQVIQREGMHIVVRPLSEGSQV